MEFVAVSVLSLDRSASGHGCLQPEVTMDKEWTLILWDVGEPCELILARSVQLIAHRDHELQI